MSKILMPSHAVGSVTGLETLWQESSLRLLSVDRNRRLFQTEMSFCEPGQRTWLTICGAAGFEMSVIRNPLKLPSKEWLPQNAMSELTAPADANGPCFGTLATSSRLRPSV